MLLRALWLVLGALAATQPSAPSGLQTLDVPNFSASLVYLPEGDWIVLRFAFPTRLKEGRFPTRAELDKAAPKHPVYYHAGPAGMTNSMGLQVSRLIRRMLTQSPHFLIFLSIPVEPPKCCR